MKKGFWKKLPVVRQLRQVALSEKVAQRKLKQKVSQYVPIEKVVQFDKLKNVDRRAERIKTQEMINTSTFQVLGMRHTPELITNLSDLIVSGEIRNEMQQEQGEARRDSQYEYSKSEILHLFHNNKASFLSFFDMRDLVIAEYNRKARQLKANQQ